MVCKEKKIFLFCIYRLLIDVIYILGHDFYGGLTSYYGINLSAGQYLISWLAFLMVAFLYNLFLFHEDRLKKSFSQQIYLLLFLLSVIPFYSMYGAGAVSDKCCFYYSLFFLSLLIVQVVLNRYFYTNTALNEKNEDKVIDKWKNKIFIFMCIIAVVSVLITFFYYVGGAFLEVSVGEEIYEQRAIFQRIQNNMPRLLVYTLSFANIIEIIMMIYCLNKKKYIYACLLLVLWYMHFSIDGSKMVLVSVVLAMAIYFVSSKITMYRVVAFHIGIAFISLLLAFLKNIYYATGWAQSVFFDVLSSLGSNTPATLFRRVIFVPARLQGVWFDYFENRTPNYWGLTTKYSVGQGLENYLSDVYNNSPLGFLNTGLLGDCFANMGDCGVFVYPLIIALILYAFDYALRGKNVIIFMGLALLFTNFLMNSMLTTVMLTHGGFLMLILLWCFPAENEK